MSELSVSVPASTPKGSPWASVRVLVTGASKGIGLGIATRFATAGARVAIAARNHHTLARAVQVLNDRGLHCEPIVADISTLRGCAEMADQVVHALGGLDVLCANAGIYPEKRLGLFDDADLRDMFAVNVNGTILSVQACLSLLRASGRGRVVVTSSITGPITGYPGLSHYAASKSAQLGFIRSAALELAVDNITINAVLPGSIRTESLNQLGSTAITRMVNTIPMQRLGTVDEIAAAVLYFASEDAGFVTGQSLVVDGGQTLPEVLGAW